MQTIKSFILFCLLSMSVATLFAQSANTLPVRIILTKEIGKTNSLISFSAKGNTKDSIMLNYGEGKLRYETLALNMKTIQDTLKGDTLWIHADSASFANFSVIDQGINNLIFNTVHKLTTVHCENNKIPLDKLPNIGDSLINYTYAPQSDLQIKGMYTLSDTIDFSRYTNLKGTKKQVQTTHFLWKNKMGDCLQKGIDYWENNGKFLFLKEQVDSVYAIFITEAFPAFDSLNPYKTSCTQINTRLSLPKLQCKLTRSASLGDTLCLTFKARKENGALVRIKLMDTIIELPLYTHQSVTVKYPSIDSVIEIYAVQNILSEFDCSHNKISQLEVGNATSLRKLNCNDNLLEVLDVSNLYYLNELNCVNNKLNFETLPTKQKHLNTYLYAPQARLKIIDSVFLYNPIDLSKYSMIQGLSDTCQPTVFKWFTESGFPLHINTDYTEKNNVFRFIKSVAEGAYVEMTSLAFPAFADTNKLRSTFIIVQEYALRTSEMINIGINPDSTLEFRFFVRANMDGVPLDIDFGNKEKVRMFANSTTTLLSGKIKGENIVIYAAEEALLYFNCFYNQIRSLDVMNCVNLQALNFSDNEVSNIDLSRNNQLKEINCSNNRLTELKVNEQSKMQKIVCNDNALTKLNLGDVSELVELNCSHNALDSLPLDTAFNLEILKCNGNKISSIDLHAHTKIKRLSLQDNRFDFSTLPLRDTLWLQYEYAPQAEIQIRDTIQNKDTLDLSRLAYRVYSPDSKDTTVFLWRNLAGDLLEEGIDYNTLDSGRFVFLKTATESVCCTLENAAFPRLRGEDAMKTTWTYLNIVADTIPLALEKNIDTKKKMSVYSVEGGIILKDAPLGQDVFIYNIQGQLIIKERSISTEQSYNLNRGFYIVRTVNEFKKVVVR